MRSGCRLCHCISHFPLELLHPPGVGIKPNVVSIGIGNVTTIGHGLKRRISDADQDREIGLRAGNLAMVDRY